jgi:hypothetical protein
LHRGTPSDFPAEIIPSRWLANHGVEQPFRKFPGQ